MYIFLQITILDGHTCNRITCTRFFSNSRLDPYATGERNSGAKMLQMIEFVQMTDHAEPALGWMLLT